MQYYNRFNHFEFEVFTTIIMKSTVFWDGYDAVEPGRNLWTFGRTYCLHFHGWRVSEASRTLLNAYLLLVANSSFYIKENTPLITLQIPFSSWCLGKRNRCYIIDPLSLKSSWYMTCRYLRCVLKLMRFDINFRYYLQDDNADECCNVWRNICFHRNSPLPSGFWPNRMLKLIQNFGTHLNCHHQG
jgi:hypothetical protein